MTTREDRRRRADDRAGERGRRRGARAAAGPARVQRVGRVRGRDLRRARRGRARGRPPRSHRRDEPQRRAAARLRERGAHRARRARLAVGARGRERATARRARVADHRDARHAASPRVGCTVTVRPDGDRRIIVIIAMPLPRPGGRHWTVVSLLDVTRERRAELALASSEGRFRQLVEQAPDAVIVVDAEGRIATCNQRTVRGVRLLAGRARRRADRAARARARRARCTSIVATSSSARRPAVRWAPGADLSGRRRDGSEFPIEVSLGTIDTPEGAQVVAIARDVTERRRAQEMVRRRQGEERVPLADEPRAAHAAQLDPRLRAAARHRRPARRPARRRSSRSNAPATTCSTCSTTCSSSSGCAPATCRISIEPVSVGRRDHRGAAPERAARAVRSTCVIPTPDRDGPWPGWAMLRPPARPSGAAQPPVERGEVQPSRRHGAGVDGRARRRAARSRSATPARGIPEALAARACSRRSSGSAPTRRSRARASGSRCRRCSSRGWAAGSSSTRSRASAARSPSRCPPPTAGRRRQRRSPTRGRAPGGFGRRAHRRPGALHRGQRRERPAHQAMTAVFGVRRDADRDDR